MQGRAWCISLLSQHEAMSSNPSTTTKKEKERIRQKTISVRESSKVIMLP
jgi:hypothetical protein